jgi:hypothetical protein
MRDVQANAFPIVANAIEAAVMAPIYLLKFIKFPKGFKVKDNT